LAVPRAPLPQRHIRIDMNTLRCLPCLLVLASHTAFAGLENGDFSDGKNKWRGDGKVEKAEGGNVLTVALSKNNFSETSQSFKMPASVKRLKVTVQVKCSENYVMNDKARSISDVDFGMGGTATWTALVYPKADFHIRLKDESWRYKLSKVTYDAWTTVVAQFRGLSKPTALELALVFAPGDGTMMVKSVTVEELKE
jgi:hypothetical protein